MPNNKGVDWMKVNIKGPNFPAHLKEFHANHIVPLWHGRKNGRAVEYSKSQAEFFELLHQQLEVTNKIPEGKMPTFNITACDVLLIAFIDKKAPKGCFEF